MVTTNNAFHCLTNSRHYDGKCKEISVERICMLMLGCILVTSLFYSITLYLNLKLTLFGKKIELVTTRKCNCSAARDVFQLYGIFVSFTYKMSEQLFLKSSFITNELNGIYCAWSKFILKDSIFTKLLFVLCRDEEFSVSGVLASDVIHASKKDIMCIFRVCKYIFFSIQYLGSET